MNPEVKEYLDRSVKFSIRLTEDSIRRTSVKLHEQKAHLHELRKQLDCEHEMVADNSGFELITATCTKCGLQDQY
ncbi:hypothetical protein VPFG_00361 [Vibrio phage nt-1]|uniref:Uncharacterized protein n=1 Tax=Vibrio phage nt-1 TaxID=115992 RepID=R9TGY5_9CAUD|nr:hypothetical protein VPFG_00361 [Vibrio phage nt-1]AGN30358.1 hypothetical protein VPFG_00361 [Vibrio phage nt-1]